VATKVPLVIRIDSELRERIIKAYPGNTITESVITALNASLSGEGETNTSYPGTLASSSPAEFFTKKEGEKALKELREEIESIKDNIDTIANRYDF
jgi:hypothetical protein